MKCIKILAKPQAYFYAKISSMTMDDQYITMMDVKSKNLLPLLEKVLTYAKKLGADQAETSSSYASGLITTVRKSTVESLEHTQDKSVSITVYLNQHKGTSSTSDFSTKSLQLCVKRAIDIAKFTSQDPYAGLLDRKYLGSNTVELDLFHPWHKLDSEQAISIASECESIGLQNSQISNSEGASLESYQSYFAIANSNGFQHHTYQTRHGLSLSLIAKSNSNTMERDYSYSIARDWKDLWSPGKIADLAAQRTIQKLNAKKINTGNYPVLFAPEMARSLIGNFLSAIGGLTQYKKTSFLLNTIHKQVFPNFLMIKESPFIKKGLASRNYDAEGMPAYDDLIVENGILQHYLLSAYSAKALKLPPTGHAGGTSNLIISHNNKTQPELIKTMGKGILVTEMMGQGLNPLTGDYSRGANGFWIENGEIQYPIEEFTVAGNLKDIFKNIVSIANDIDLRSSIHVGSMLIDNMMIAGN